MDTVEIYRAANEMEAQIIRGRLEEEGIPVLLRYEAAGPVFGLAVGALAEVRVLVPAALAEQARLLLAPQQDDTTPGAFPSEEDSAPETDEADFD
jgi:hypothetical protein